MKRILLFLISGIFSLSLTAQISGFYSPIEQNMLRTPRTITQTAANSITPPYAFNAYLNTPIFPTFCISRNYYANQSLTISLSDYNANCNCYVFNKENPLNFSSCFSTVSESTKTYTLPQSGEYIIIVVLANPPGTQRVTCSVQIGNEYFADELIAYNSFLISHTGNAYTHYATFTSRSTRDPMLIMARNDSISPIIGYNDNYSKTSDYTWGNEARIDENFQNFAGRVIVVDTAFHYQDFPLLHLLFPNQSPSFLTDLYIRCEVTFNEQAIFENLKEWDAIVSGYPTLSHNPFRYNCHAWAGGIWDHFVFPDDTFSSYSDGFIYPDDLQAYDTYYQTRGYTREGATANNCDVDLWASYGDEGNLDSYTHSSIRAHGSDYATGYDWESKIGAYYRIFHPRNAFSGEEHGYGSIAEHYRRIYVPGEIEEPIPADPIPQPASVIYENTSFSDDETEELEALARQIPQNVVQEFYALYDKAEKEIEATLSGSWRALKRTEGFQNLLSFCKRNPQTIYAACLRLEKEDLLPTMLIEETILEANRDALALIKKDCLRRIKDEANNQEIIICRTIPTNTILFVKAVLLKNRTNSLEEFNKGTTTLSSDESICAVRQNGNTITIDLNIEKESSVTLNVSSSFGTPISTPVCQEKLSKGKFTYVVDGLKQGAYVVTCHINNNIYSRKTFIK